jgi:translation initiation factor IF-1
MPKNKKGGSKHKKQKNSTDRGIRCYFAGPGEIYGYVIKGYGQSRYDIQTEQGVYMSRIRGKIRRRVPRMTTNHIVVIMPWECNSSNDNKKAAIMYVYRPGEHKALMDLEEFKYVKEQLFCSEQNEDSGVIFVESLSDVEDENQDKSIKPQNRILDLPSDDDDYYDDSNYTYEEYLKEQEQEKQKFDNKKESSPSNKKASSPTDKKNQKSEFKKAKRNLKDERKKQRDTKFSNIDDGNGKIIDFDDI